MDNSPPPSAATGAAPLPPPLPSAGSSWGQPPRRPPGRVNPWLVVSIILMCVLVVFGVGTVLSAFQGFLGGSQVHRASPPKLEEVLVEDNHSSRKILILPIEGIILSQGNGLQGQDIVQFTEEALKQAARDDRIKAVVLKVNSPGGEVLASDDISQAIRKFQSTSGKPVVASMGSVAASGGYYVSAPCRWIVAHELTLTGSIGVIMSAYNLRALMDKVGVRPEVFKSGKYKDMLSMDKKESDITPEERAMVQKLVDQTFGRFKRVVAEGRKEANERNKSSSEAGQTLGSSWEDYADGRVLAGQEAFELGLVDELGNFETAVKRARRLTGIEDANLVQYQPLLSLSSLLRLFGKARAANVKLDIGMDLPRLETGKLYFLAPTFVH